MEDMSKNDFLNEDGHGGLRESDADAYSWWLTDRLKECVGEVVHAVRKFQAECPDGRVMTEAEEIDLEAVAHDLVTETLAHEFAELRSRLEESGHNADSWESRWTQIDRQRRLGGGA